MSSSLLHPFCPGVCMYCVSSRLCKMAELLATFPKYFCPVLSVEHQLAGPGLEMLEIVRKENCLRQSEWGKKLPGHD